MNFFLIFSLLSLWLVISAWKPELRNRKIGLAVMLILMLVLVLDFKVGVDTGSYIWLYKSILRNEIDFRNMGYVYLIRTVQMFTDRYALSVLAANIICIGLCFYTMIRYSRNHLMSFFLFFASGIFLMYYSSGVRQMLAMAVFLFAYYEYLPGRKYIRYFVCCLLSVSFHEAGIISFLIPLIFLYQKLYRKNRRITLLASAGGIVLGFGLITFAVPWIVDNYWWVPVVSHFVRYLENTSISVLGLGMECVWFAAALMLYLLSGRERRTDWDQFQIMTWGFVFAAYLCMARFPQTSRLCDYVQVIMLVSIPNWFEMIPDRKKKTAAVLPLIGLNFILLYGDMQFAVPMIQKNYPEIKVSMLSYPYIFIFDEQSIEKYYGRFMQ